MDYSDKLSRKNKRYKRRNLVAKDNKYFSRSFTPKVKYSRKSKYPTSLI